MVRWRPNRRGLRLAATGVVVLSALTLLVGERGAGSAKPSVFVSVAGSDRNPCSRQEPCASFGRGYRVARPGEVVEVGGGFYPGQSITSAGGKVASKPVVLRPRPGAEVVLAGLRLGTSLDADDGPHGVTIQDMRIADAGGSQGQVAAFEGTRDVVLEDIDAANFYLNGVRNFTIDGGDWGPCTTTSTTTRSNEAVDGCSNSKIDGNPANHDITIQDAVFHDYRIQPGSGAHFECMIIFGGTDITIRRNKFRDCEFYDIFIQNLWGHRFDGLTIENNWFDAPWNGSGAQNRPGAIAFSPRAKPFTDVLIRYNSFLDTGMALNDDGDGTAYTAFRVLGNIATATTDHCHPTVTYRANLWIGPPCHPTDRRPPFGYVLRAGVLRPHPTERRAVRRIFAEAANGRGIFRIVRTLERSRMPAPRGDRWAPPLVRSILRDRAYLGGTYGPVGAHPALIGRRAWKAARKRRQR